jgi:DNA-binding GntR family transcriptional regulator
MRQETVAMDAGAPAMRGNAGDAGSLHRIVEQIEEDIVFGRLHPRERLVEEELTERFNANRHVIRQALVELEHMGIVERKRNRGAVVREILPTDAEKVYAVREILEIAAARSIPLPASPELIDRLRAVQEQHSEGVDAGDLRRVFRMNMEFHRILFSACGNPYLWEGIAHFAHKSHSIRSYSITDPGYLRIARDEHWAMIDALQTGDRERLVELCRRHIARGKDAYLAAYRARYGTR